MARLSIDHPQSSDPQDDLEATVRALRPISSVWKTVVALVSAAMVLGSVSFAVQSFVANTASKDYVDEKVSLIETRVESIEEGVEKLVSAQEESAELDKKRRKLEIYSREYEQALQEFTADKASGQPSGPRPRKTSEHIALELEVMMLEQAR